MTTTERGASDATRHGEPSHLTVWLAGLALALGCHGPSLADMDWRQGSSAGPKPEALDKLSAHFGYCRDDGGPDCVVDGDTFRFHGRTYRIADIDTPETHEPRCAAEGALGARATRRLMVLMNAGAFSLEEADRDSDRYGRLLRVVVRGGESVGAVLVAEGLARRWDGARHPWRRLSDS